MKQKDIILIIVMVFIAATASLIVSRFLFGSPSSREQTAEVVDVITPEFQTPPKKYFNNTAINPAEPISLGAENKPD